MVNVIRCYVVGVCDGASTPHTSAFDLKQETNFERKKMKSESNIFGKRDLCQKFLELP
jgi:hypothetical protein